MDAELLQQNITQLDAGLRQLKQAEREAREELERRTEARLRQEGAIMVMQQLLQAAHQHTGEVENA
jgi:hypothetical protein